MAVTRIWPVVSNLSGVQSYIANPNKTYITVEEYENMHTPDSINDAPEEMCLVRGINCSPKHAIDQFNIVKEQFDKANNPIQAYHGCISFAQGEVTPKETVAIAKDFVESVWGDNYQVLLAAHLNTQHLHCHYLINSVSFVDGHMLHAEKAWFLFRQKADDICKKHGKSIIDNPDRSTRKGPTDREKAALDCLERALSGANSFPEFLANIQNEPCVVNFSMQNKYWTILPDGWTVPVTTDKLGDQYTKDNILEKFPDANEAVEKFTIPPVIDRVDLQGYQDIIADRIKSIIKDNLIFDDREPNKTYLPRKVKKQVCDMTKGLEIMIDMRITNKPIFDRFLLLQNQKLSDLKKQRTKMLAEHIDIGTLGDEIIRLSEDTHCLAEIKESFETKIVPEKIDTIQEKVENYIERSEFI